MGHLSVPVGLWKVDAIHSSVEFSARHLMVGRVRGRFNDFSGSFTVSDEGAKARVSASVEIDPASVDTGNEKRDGDLRSRIFLDVDRHASLRFTIDETVVIGDLEPDDDGAYVLDLPGDLTIRAKTSPLVLKVTYEGTVIDQKLKERLAFVATSKINRRDWDLTWNMALDKGGVLIGDMVDLSLEIEAVRVE